MQHRVDDEMRTMGGQQLALLPGFSPQDRNAEHHIAFDAMRPTAFMVHERQHVGSAVAATVASIERLSFRFSYKAQRNLGVASERGAYPATERRRLRQILVGDGVLYGKRQSRASALVHR